MTPIYETAEDREQEKLSMQEMAEFFGERFTKYPGKLPRTDMTSVSYVAEHKRRNVPAARYADIFVEKGKYDALWKRWKREKKIPIFVVRFDDALGYIHLLHVDCSKLRTMNRTDRRDPNDADVGYSAKVSDFYWIRR